jgi:uncharacterized membrane protein
MTSAAFEAHWPLALLALVPMLWWVRRRSTTNLGPRHLTTLTFLRTGALVLLVLALMRPVWTAGASAVSVVYAVDVSRSVAAGFVQGALEFAARATHEGAPASERFVVFARTPRLLASAADVAKVAVTENAQAGGVAIQQGATDLERALDEALLGFAPDAVKRLVLFTDGNQTHGDVWRVLPRLKEQGVRVFVFPAAPRALRDAWVESIDVPAGVRRDEPVGVTVRVVSAAQSRARVRLFAGDEELDARTITLEPGANSVALRARLRRSGLAALTAQVQAQGDQTSQNDTLRQSLWVAGRARVLYAEAQTESAGYLRDALAREGLDVTVVVPAGLPESADALAAYDAVILSDASASELGEARMAALAAYVRDLGGGLLFAAGENTYGKAGFSDTALERLLPVEFKAQEKRKDLALVICLDRSYSMKGRPMDLAKAAARAALELLEEQHRFGVVAFDSQPQEAVPLQYVRGKRRAEDLIDRIQASGQTNIYPALATAWRMLQNVDTKRKHVILLSDGDTAPADFERLIKRMTDAKITVTTVTIGRSGDPELMSRIARWGQGRAYQAEDVSEVPQIFVEDTQNVARTTLIEEPLQPLVKRRAEAMRGVDFATAPPLLGFASTKAKEGAELLLASESGAPILARWQYGLGKAVVFTSDVKDRWAAQWLQWEGYGKFWTQLVRDTMRRDAGEAARLEVVREGDEALVSLELMTGEGGWHNRLLPQARVKRPDGSVAPLALRQTAPGRYAARMPVATSTTRPFGFELIEGGGVSRELARRVGTRELFYPLPDEYRAYPPDVELLRALAEQTGGKLGPAIPDIFSAQGDVGRTRTPLWPWLAAIGLVFYLLDIALRRSPWLRRWLDVT